MGKPAGGMQVLIVDKGRTTVKCEASGLMLRPKRQIQIGRNFCLQHPLTEPEEVVDVDCPLGRSSLVVELLLQLVVMDLLARALKSRVSTYYYIFAQSPCGSVFDVIQQF